MWITERIRSPGFYAYCLVGVAMTMILIVVIFDREDSIFPNCLPPRRMTKKWSRENVTLRVVGGEFAEPDEYPYRVSFIVYHSHQLCGGGLISKKHVLTAAHCLDYLIELNREDFSVVVGINYLLEPTAEHYGIAEMTRHPSYNLKPLRNDIGVVRLEQEVDLSKNAAIIELPKPGRQYLYHGQELDVSGFGFVAKEGPRSDYLKKLTTYACSYDICEYIYGNVRSTGHFCTSSPPGSGICSGDSGNPVTIDKKIVIGIVSAGHCGFGYPDLPAYVPDFLDFIKSEMRK